jgi:hypothetical protein
MTDDLGTIDLQDDNEKEEDPSEVAAAEEQIVERCKAIQIPVEVRGSSADGVSFLAVGMPCGKERRWLSLWGLERLKEFLAIPFEKYTFLGSYEAVCSYKEDYIEASIEAINRGSVFLLIRRLFKRNTMSEIDLADQRLEIADSSGMPRKVIIEQLSSDLSILTRSRRRYGLAIRISGFGATRHDQALGLLERISNSLFFQIDMTQNLPLCLVRGRSSSRRRVSGVRSPVRAELEFPQMEYNEVPMSLYWYARSASGMPLLQYLAYYQTIEYYFPMYSHADAIRKVRNELKNPAFRRDSDDDLSRIVSAVRAGGSSGGFGDERSQLRATILECLDPDELRLFLVSDQERKEFFSSAAKSLTAQRVPINKVGADLRTEIADRIYDIRCKIVHTKGGGQEANVELLLPFSKEAESLYFDIELIQYIARKVLIAASAPIRLRP